MFKKTIKLIQMDFHKQYKEIQREQHPLEEIFWETTLRCNAKCKHCGSSAGEKNYPDELTTCEIKNAFKQIANNFNANSIWIDVTGGEPLLRNDLCEVMKYASSLGFHWGMTSNGMLLTDELIQKLKEAKLESISISIDGLEKTHDNFRGVPGSYKKIIENVKKLQSADFLKHLQITTVFSKVNINEIESLYSIFLNLGIKRWRLMSIDPIGRTTNSLLLEAKETKYLLDFIKQHKNKKMKLLYGCPSFIGLEYEKEVREHFFYCRTGITVASILYNGDLYVCPNVPRIKRLIQGNIRIDNFKDIWEKKYKEFREKNRMKCNMCEKCEYWEACLGGAYHTWNFDKKSQNRCIYNLLKGDELI